MTVIMERFPYRYVEDGVIELNEERYDDEEDEEDDDDGDMVVRK